MKKTYWLVVTMFYDDGEVIASIDKIEREEKPSKYFVSTNKYDCYRDYFDNEAEATAFYQKALKA